MKVEAEINRIAKGIQNFADKSNDVIDKGKEIKDKASDFFGCNNAIGGSLAVLAIIGIAGIVLFKIKKSKH